MKGSSIATIAAVALAIPAVKLCEMAAAFGHGTYVPAMLLFPYSMISSIIHANIGLEEFSVALLQWPMYAALVSLANASGKLRFAVVTIAAIHLIAFVLCFVLPGSCNYLHC